MTENGSSTISVEHLPQYNAIRMTAQHYIKPRDVGPAFAKVTRILETSSYQMVVIIDLRQKPNIPLGVILKGALDGPYCNTKLKEWLVIDKSPSAQLIEKTLAAVTGRRNVRWFGTEEEVSTYLKNSKER